MPMHMPPYNAWMARMNLKLTLAQAVKQVQKTRMSLPIRRNGRLVAAVVSAEDFQDLVWLDRTEAQIARRAIERARARGEKPIPIATVWKRLNLPGSIPRPHASSGSRRGGFSRRFRSQEGG